jgi:Protein of unknown function (DUF2488)
MTTDHTTYYYVLSSAQYMLEAEPTHDVLNERKRHYGITNKTIDFWLIEQPAFLAAPEFAKIDAQVPKPAAAIVSTDKSFITWLKLRLEYVIVGEFQQSEAIPQPLASLVASV